MPPKRKTPFWRYFYYTLLGEIMYNKGLSELSNHMHFLSFRIDF